MSYLFGFFKRDMALELFVIFFKLNSLGGISLVFGRPIDFFAFDKDWHSLAPASKVDRP